MDGSSSRWRRSTRATEFDALWDEMEEDDMLRQMLWEDEEDDAVEQWWVGGMKYEDEW